LKQTFNGVDIVNADMSINIKEGTILSYSSSFYTGDVPTVDHGLFNGQLIFGNNQKISALDSIVFLSKYIKKSINKENLVENVEASLNGETPYIISNIPFAEDEKAKVSNKYIIVTSPYHTLVPVWDILLRMADGENWFRAQMDISNGNILQIVDWVHEAKYNVYPVGVNDPHDGDRELVINPEDKDASPIGWHDQGSRGKFYTTTIGNNVWASSNWDGTDSYKKKFRPQGSKGRDGALTFDFPIDLHKSPRNYINASVTNLFYWNNIRRKSRKQCFFCYSP
jgi:extracellular elastinolytic metalloproteinase